MIYITGDTHGLIDFNKLDSLDKIYTSEKDVLIILGDAGIVWDYKSLDKNIFKYSLLGLTIVYIDGNHENFELLSKFPIITKFGAKMHLISKNIYHVLRGEIMQINDLKFFCLGGAISIDRIYRVLNISYWFEEEISNEDIKNSLDNLNKVNYKVDYVLTHCIDSKVLQDYFNYKKDACSEKLLFIDKIVDYKYWLFGHYHIDNQIDNKKRCLYNDIIEIKSLYKGNRCKRYNGYIYTTEDYRKRKTTSILPYLYSNFDYNTKIKSEDLPEWYVAGRYHKRHGYLLAKDIESLKYYPNMWINHYLRDDILKITYKNKKYVLVSGIDIVKMILAIEKYEGLNLTYLKRKINFKANFYNHYHKEKYDYKYQEKAFKEVNDIKEIENVICHLINRINKDGNTLSKAAEYVMDSYLSDKIFETNTSFYLKSIDELYVILLKEIKKLRNKEVWRYSY